MAIWEMSDALVISTRRKKSARQDGRGHDEGWWECGCLSFPRIPHLARFNATYRCPEDNKRNTNAKIGQIWQDLPSDFCFGRSTLNTINVRTRSRSSDYQDSRSRF